MANMQGLLKQTVLAVQSGLGAPATTGGQIIRRTNAVFTLDRDKYSNPEIVSHQMDTGDTAGIQKTSGKLDGVMSPGTYAALFAALVRKAWAATSAISSASLTIGAATAGIYPLTRATGSWLTDGVKVGDVLRLSVGSLNAANISKNVLVTDVTSATVLQVKPLNGVALVAEGPITGCTVTVIGKKVWTPTSGHTNLYFTVEECYTDGSKFEQFNDVKVAKADVTSPATGNATVGFDMPGLSRTRGTSATIVSPTSESSTNPLTAVNGVIVVNGAAITITGATVSIMGNIQAGEAEVGSNSISDHIRGQIAVSGQFTAKFSATTLQDIYDNQTEVTLILAITDGSSATADFVTFVLPAIKLFGDAPDDGEAKEIVRTYPFSAKYYASGGAAVKHNATIISIQDSQAP